MCAMAGSCGKVLSRDWGAECRGRGEGEGDGDYCRKEPPRQVSVQLRCPW